MDESLIIEWLELCVHPFIKRKLSISVLDFLG